MIKFIAADLDGTLLNEKKDLPPDFDYVLDRLNDMGIRFAISSGRQYSTILEQFGKYSDRLIYIAENGAIAFDKGKRLVCDTMDKETVLEIEKTLHGKEGLYTLICCADKAYGLPVPDSDDGKLYIKNVNMYYKSFEFANDIDSIIKNNDVVKVAVYDKYESETHTYPLLKKFYDTHNVVISGKNWLDVMELGTTKGTAIEKLQRLYNIKPEECMAFGDFMNDADMMRVCRESYAMGNAHPDLKALCRHTADTNENFGVTKTIREVVFGE